MNMGHSGAVITIKDGIVVKQGSSQDLNREAELLIHLGPMVCPTFLGYYHNLERDKAIGYRMELCDVPVTPTSMEPLMKLFRGVLELLTTSVWPRPALYPTEGWEAEHQAWVQCHAPWLFQPHGPPRSPSGPCLTHGDPTLANLLIRRTTRAFLLGDPIAPRPGIPSVRAVDLGKLLQSAAGWENCYDSKWHHRHAVVPWLLNRIPANEALTAIYWASFACARIAVRTTDPKKREWGVANSRRFARMVGK